MDLSLPTVYILVVCAHKENNGEYDKLAATIRDTWGNSPRQNVKVFFLWCNNYTRTYENDYVLNQVEGYGKLLWKTLGFLFEHRHDKFDYIFRTNVGCYVHIDRMLRYLSDKPREKFYGGVVGDFHTGTVGDVEIIQFVSGTGFFLSKDLVTLSLSKIKSFGFDYIDDMSFGRFMKRNGIVPTGDFSRFYYHGEDMGCDSTFQWKLRSPDGSRHLDCQNMIKLYKHFNYDNPTDIPTEVQ